MELYFHFLQDMEGICQYLGGLVAVSIDLEEFFQCRTVVQRFHIMDVSSLHILTMPVVGRLVWLAVCGRIVPALAFGCITLK